jgi:hypothetical protein
MPLPWQIWRVGFNAPSGGGVFFGGPDPMSTSGGGQGFFAL